MYKCETDLDLPEVRRACSNFWKAKCFEYMREIAKANTGIRRLRKRLDSALQKIESLSNSPQQPQQANCGWGEKVGCKDQRIIYACDYDGPCKSKLLAVR